MKRTEKVQHLLREYAESLVIAVGLALIVRIFVISAFHIPTASMDPTLKPGDFILAYRLPFGLNFGSVKIGGRQPQRGEVVVFKCPQNLNTSCVKRVIGVPGDRIQIVKKRLFINGEEAQYNPIEKNEEGIIFSEKLKAWKGQILVTERAEREDMAPFIVPPSKIFVLGDRRDTSEDSRNWGPVPVQSIEAQVLLIWLSIDWKSQGFNLRFDRLFKLVH